MQLSDEVKNSVRYYPDFPKKGVMFRDLSKLMANHDLRSRVIDDLAGRAWKTGTTHVLGLDARGFIFGALVADALKVPFVMARKPGKLPPTNLVIEIPYKLEYREDVLCVPYTDIPSGSKVMICDDLLATGGTAWAAGKAISTLTALNQHGRDMIIERAKYGNDIRYALPENVGVDISMFGFVMEIVPLMGRTKIANFGVPIHSVSAY